MNQNEAAEVLRQLVDEGYLVGVEVFGDAIEYRDAGVEWSFGLCDVFSKNTPGGSDCNRAEKFLLRPCNPLMTPELAALIVDESTTRPFDELKDWPKSAERDVLDTGSRGV